MQVTGEVCAVCAEKVVTADEGTWCAECSTRFHVVCIARRQELCPCCNRRRAFPEHRAVHGRLCTECLHLHREPAPACRECGSSMTYADAAALALRRRDVRGHARRAGIAGVLMLVAGLALVAAFWVLLVVTAIEHRLFMSGSLLIGGLALATAGGRKLWVAGRLAKFS